MHAGCGVSSARACASQPHERRFCLAVPLTCLAPQLLSLVQTFLGLLPRVRMREAVDFGKCELNNCCKLLVGLFELPLVASIIAVQACGARHALGARRRTNAPQHQHKQRGDHSLGHVLSSSTASFVQCIARRSPSRRRGYQLCLAATPAMISAYGSEADIILGRTEVRK